MRRGVPASPSGLRPFGAEPQDASQAKPLVPNADEPAPMPARMRRFLEKPPRRLLPETVASRRNKIIRKSQPKGWLTELCDLQRWQCAYCHRNMRRKESPKHPGRHATLDHVLPISRGGRNQWDNLVAACAQCNHAKGSLTAEEFHAASAGEAGTAETVQLGSVHEHAAPQGETPK